MTAVKGVCALQITQAVRRRTCALSAWPVSWSAVR